MDQESGPGHAGRRASYPGTSRAKSHADCGLSPALRRSIRKPAAISNEAAKTATMPVPPCPEPLAVPCDVSAPPPAHGKGFWLGAVGKDGVPPPKPAETLPVVLASPVAG